MVFVNEDYVDVIEWCLLVVDCVDCVECDGVFEFEVFEWCWVYVMCYYWIYGKEFCGVLFD